MRYPILQLTCAAILISVASAARAQQSHWAAPDDKTAKFMIDMERKWGKACA
jgi:hypothetical protein